MPSSVSRFPVITVNHDDLVAGFWSVQGAGAQRQRAPPLGPAAGRRDQPLQAGGGEQGNGGGPAQLRARARRRGPLQAEHWHTGPAKRSACSPHHPAQGVPLLSCVRCPAAQSVCPAPNVLLLNLVLG